MSRLEISKLSKELHKPYFKNFPTRRVLVTKLNDTFTADLVDMKEWENENEGYKYMLNVMDVFSRYAWSTPLKNKNSKSILNAFKNIIDKSNRKPNRLWVDQGKEFYNKDMKKYLEENKIKIYSTYGENKATIIERFNRTLKNMMWRYFTTKNTRKWIDVIDKLINKYNNSEHSTIGMTPKQASNIKNYEKVLKNTYEDNDDHEDYYDKDKTKHFNVGDWVRISRVKGKFEKGYLPNWSREIFQIKEVLNTNPVTYKLTEYNGNEIKGTFYKQELQETRIPEFYEVEKVLKTKIKNGKKYYYVKYLGYDNSYNEWISEDNIKDI